MNKTLLVAITAMLVCSANARAQAWPQQPASVLGIELGTPITAQTLPLCVRPATVEEMKRLWASGKDALAPCIDPPAAGTSDRSRWLRGMPKLGEVGYAANLVLHEGQVESLYLTLDQLRFDQMKAILIEKYGSPTKVGRNRVTTGSGAVLTSETLEWRGDRVLIEARERSSRADQSSVIFTSLSVAARSAATDNKTTRDAAGKL